MPAYLPQKCHSSITHLLVLGVLAACRGACSSSKDRGVSFINFIIMCLVCEDRPSVKAALWDYHTIIKELDQFVIGLKMAGVLKLIRQYHRQDERLVCFFFMCIFFIAYLKSLFTPTFSSEEFTRTYILFNVKVRMCSALPFHKNLHLV